MYKRANDQRLGRAHKFQQSSGEGDVSASSGVVLCHGMLSSQVAIRLAAAPVCCSTMLDWLSGSLAKAERALECIWFQGLSQGLEASHHLRKDSKPQGMQCGW